RRSSDLFGLIVLVGGVGWIIGVIRFVVVAVLTEHVRLLRYIQISWQLGRGRKPGRFIMAFRGGLPAEAIIRSRPLPVRIGFGDQLGVCYGIAFSVGSEFIVSHWSARFLFRAPSPDAHTFDNTRRATSIINLSG